MFIFSCVGLGFIKYSIRVYGVGCRFRIQVKGRS